MPLSSLPGSLGDVASGEANIGQFPIRQGCQLASRLTGTTPLAKAGKNERKKHDATSIISPHKRIRAAHWQREEKGPHVRWPSLGRKPATGRPWRRRGHLQLTQPRTNLKVVAPGMRNEHGTVGERLHFVEICSDAALREPNRSMMLVPDCGEIGRKLPGTRDALP